jgi:hypothetical protein
VLREALRRYELFLSLLASWDAEAVSEPLVPPLDVVWLWHCHKLAPRHYHADCQARARARGRAGAARGQGGA